MTGFLAEVLYGTKISALFGDSHQEGMSSLILRAQMPCPGTIFSPLIEVAQCTMLALDKYDVRGWDTLG